MFIDLPLKSLLVVPLVLSNKHFLNLMNAVTAQPDNVNKLLTCLLKCNGL